MRNKLMTFESFILNECDKSDKNDKVKKPRCPECGKKMKNCKCSADKEN